MNDIEIIRSKIYEIRGQKVMLDYDLAEMYGVETAQLKRAVRRNIQKFEGDDFIIGLHLTSIRVYSDLETNQYRQEIHKKDP